MTLNGFSDRRVRSSVVDVESAAMARWLAHGAYQLKCMMLIGRRSKHPLFGNAGRLRVWAAGDAGLVRYRRPCRPQGCSSDGDRGSCGPIVTHCRARVGMPGSDLSVAQPTCGLRRRGDCGSGIAWILIRPSGVIRHSGSGSSFTWILWLILTVSPACWQR